MFKIFTKTRTLSGKNEIRCFGKKIVSYKTHKINYKNYSDLLFDIKSNIHKLPSNLDLIVGIPRSGMIPAYMIGLALNKPVCSLNEFLSGSFGSHGYTRKLSVSDDIKNILIIDDSINTGKQYELVKKQLSDIQHKYQFTFAAVYYSTDQAFSVIDIPLVFVPQPRMFAWNYLNHALLSRAALDIDGVLCVDPTEKENDDGEKYEHFLLNARPLYIPKHKVAALVTSRLGKYRKLTEKWLSDNGVQYDKLYMLENKTAAQRRELGLHAAHKAAVYKKLKNCDLFIESEPVQAQQIAKLSGKRVVCSQNDIIY